MGALDDLAVKDEPKGALADLAVTDESKGALADLAVSPAEKVTKSLSAIPQPVKTAANVISALPGPIGDIRSGLSAVNTAVNALPEIQKAMGAVGEKAAQTYEALPEPIKAGIQKQANNPMTPLGQAKTALKIYDVASKPSRAITEAAEKFLSEKGAPDAWAMAGGMVAGAPFDPLMWIPGAKAVEATGVTGLTAAGKSTAEKVVASVAERAGEAAAAKVPELAATGNLKAIKTLIDTKQTNLAFGPHDIKLLDKTIQKTDEFNKIWQTRQALRSGEAEPLAAKKITSKITSLENKMASEISSPYGQKVDKLRAKRDELATKTFRRGDDNYRKIQDLNTQIQRETKIAEKMRSSRIDEIRGKLEDANSSLDELRKSAIEESTTQLKKRVEQLRGMRGAVTEKFVAPIEDDLLRGIVQLDDQGLAAKARSVAGNLTFLVSKLDEGSNGGWTRYVFEPQINAENKLDAAITSYRNRLRDIQAKSGIESQSDDALFRMYREKKIPVPDAKKQQFEAANQEYQKMMDELLNTYNKAAESRGSKKIIVPKEDYVFHTRKMNSIFDLTDSNIDDLAKDADSLMYIKRNDPSFQSWKRRYDLIPEGELAGAFEAADKYASLVARYDIYGPMVRKFRTLSRVALESGKQNLSKQLGAIADNMTGDAAVKSGKGLEAATGGALDYKFQNAINKTASRFAQNAIASFSSGINQVAGIVNNAIYSGVARSAFAPIEGLSAKIFERSVQALTDADYSLFAHKYSKVLKGHLAELPPRFGERNLNLVQRTTLNFFQYMNDAVNVGTFNQMYKAAMVSGYSHEQAIKIADSLLAKTQAIYRDAFKPSIISKSSSLGRLVSPLSTYVFNSANALANDVVFSKLGTIEKSKALARVMATGVLVNAGVYAAAGKKPLSASDMIPFLRMLEMGPGVFAVGSRSISNLKRKQYLMAVAEPAALLLPGGSRQILQTISGAKAISSGRVQSPVGAAKALLFGPPYGGSEKR